MKDQRNAENEPENKMEAGRKQFLVPDFRNSIVNISATLAEFLGAPNRNETLPILKEELGRGYRTIVFLCFDGLGMYPLRKNLDQTDFLFQNLRQVLLSTFPSTTTNATTSLLTNQLPLEHGWFGWSMHFAALHRNVDIYLGRDSATREAVSFSDYPLGRADCYFDHEQRLRGPYGFPALRSRRPSGTKSRFPDRRGILVCHRGELPESRKAVCVCVLSRD